MSGCEAATHIQPTTCEGTLNKLQGKWIGLLRGDGGFYGEEIISGIWKNGKRGRFPIL